MNAIKYKLLYQTIRLKIVSGSLFSYTSNRRESMKPIRNYILENESIKNMEDSFTDHLTETIIANLSRVSSLDPLKIKTIKVEPIVGNDVFTVHLNDLEIRGLSDVDIQDLRPRLSALKLRIGLLFPQVKINCRYSVNGTAYKVLDVRGNGDAKLEYSDVLLRTQINLAYENNTLQIKNSDPPLVDFGSAQIKLSKHDNNDTNLTAKAGDANELGSLLFWILADHIVQEVDDYLLQYINESLRLFKVNLFFENIYESHFI